MEQHWTLKVLRFLTKRDDLQDAIALVRKSITDFLLQYENFRD